MNTDHIAWVETDRFGNSIEKGVIPWISYGKRKEQLKALTGDVCKAIVEKALECKKPLVIEQLDFKKKKTTLKESSNKFARLLSGFAYSLFFVFLMSRAFKNGIAVHQVNPAYTSLIGRVNYAKRYGLSIHLAAALAIARRYQKFSEAPVSSVGKIPDGKGRPCRFCATCKESYKTRMALLGTGKEENQNGARSTFSGDEKSILGFITLETIINSRTSLV